MIDPALQSWFDGLDRSQQAGLLEIAQSRLPKPSNGHGTAPSDETGVELVCVSAAELIAWQSQQTLNYVDINELLPLYDKLFFNLSNGSGVLIKGPKGEGKSLGAECWSVTRQIPYFRFNGSEGSTKLDIQGSFFLRGRATPFSLGRVAAAVNIANEYGRCLLILEEVNALPPTIQKMLNSIVDYRRNIEIDALQKTFRLNPGAKLQVLATMNPSTYGGTYQINEDLKSRFLEIEIGYPAQAEEIRVLKGTCAPEVFKQVDDNTVTLLARFAKDTRQGGTGYALSTRDLVTALETTALLGLDTALQLLLHKFEGDDRKVAYKRLTSLWPAQQLSHLRKHWRSSDRIDA